MTLVSIACKRNLTYVNNQLKTVFLCAPSRQTVTWLTTQGALVCMSRRDMLVYPGDVIICRRSCAEPGSCLFAVHFLPHNVTFNIHRWCQASPCGGNWRLCTSWSACQNALKPDRDNFLLSTRYSFYFVQRVNISKLIFVNLQQEV